MPGKAATCNVVVLTLDAHAAGPINRVEDSLGKHVKGLRVHTHAAAEWSENPRHA